MSKWQFLAVGIEKHRDVVARKRAEGIRRGYGGASPTALDNEVGVCPLAEVL